MYKPRVSVIVSQSVRVKASYMKLCEEKKLELQSLNHLNTFRWRAVLTLLIDNERVEST